MPAHHSSLQKYPEIGKEWITQEVRKKKLPCRFTAYTYFLDEPNNFLDEPNNNYERSLPHDSAPLQAQPFAKPQIDI